MNLYYIANNIIPDTIMKFIWLCYFNCVVIYIRYKFVECSCLSLWNMNNTKFNFNFFVIFLIS